jgi:hypothetical protein
VILTYVIESEAVTYGVILYEQAKGIGRLPLEPAVVDVEDLVEKLADVESKAAALAVRKGSRIFGREYPSFIGGAEFQLVTVFYRARRANYGRELRNLQMADSCQLVVHLALLGGKLDFVGKGLPAATAAGAEMRTERLEALRGGLVDPNDTAFQETFLFAGDTDINDVAGDCELYEKNSARFILGVAFKAGVRNRLAFGGKVFNQNVVNDYVQRFVS